MFQTETIREVKEMPVSTHIAISARHAAVEQLNELSEKYQMSRPDILDAIIDMMWLIDTGLEQRADFLAFGNYRTKKYRPAKLLEHIPVTIEEYYEKMVNLRSPIEPLLDFADKTNRTIVIVCENPYKEIITVKLYVTRVGVDQNNLQMVQGNGKLVFVDPTAKDPYEFDDEDRRTKVFMMPNCNVPSSKMNGPWLSFVRRDEKELQSVVENYWGARPSLIPEKP